MSPLRLLAISSLLLVPNVLAQTLEVPDGNKPVLTAEGRGVQIYRCAKKLEEWNWGFVAPEAKLYVDEGVVAMHGAGPVWNHIDGSSIHGKLIASVTSPELGSIPWLILKGIDPTGNGALSTVTYIRRIKTRGGQAPETGCDSDHAGLASRVPYTATYIFYAAAK